MKTGYIIKHVAGTFFFFPGIVYTIIAIIMVFLNYTVFKLDPALLAERSKPGEGTKKWDKLILGLSFLSTLALYLVAGLDSGRFHWSPDFSRSLFIIGIVLTVCGQLLFLIAQKQNKFFSSTVRIQADREHSVCQTGLYGFVRHPAYLGSIVQSAGFPLLFGSLWSIIPSGLIIILHLIRTGLEDKTLRAELKGYYEYTFKTRYKLLPYVW
jgi:protein-S-isoprenylcysteine O-methyltransferase Ste14